MKKSVTLLPLAIVAGLVGLFAFGNLSGGEPHPLSLARAAALLQPGHGGTEIGAAAGAGQANDPAPEPTPLPPTLTPLPTEVPTATPTAAPTDTASPTAAPSPEPTPTAAYLPAAERVELTGFRHEWQTMNNCGPVTMGMNLSYYGTARGQAEIAAAIRAHQEDKSVTPEEMVAYAWSQGYLATLRANGTADTLRRLVSNGVPVIAVSWYESYDGDAMGHYRLVTGYDDATGEWILYDSLRSTVKDWQAPYHGIRVSYEEMDRLWGILNYRYIVVFPEETNPLVSAIIGDDVDDTIMWQRSLDRAFARVAERPDDAFAWYALGDNLIATNQPEEAAAAYDRAIEIGLPWRAHWYRYGAFEAYYRVGRHLDVIALADSVIANTRGIEEVYYWKGRAHAALGETDAARQALQRAVTLRPSFQPAQEALAGIGG